MSFLITLVASDIRQNPIESGHIEKTQALLEKANIFFTCAPVWLAKGEAVDLGLTDKPDKDRISAIKNALSDRMIDVFLVPIENRRKKIMFADMDSTIVSSETLDELATHAGKKEEIAEITKQAMEGSLNFESALRERVSMLKDLPETMLRTTLQNTKLNKGAKCLVSTMKMHGAACILLSSGFSYFTHAVGKDLGFDVNHGNSLEIRDGMITGNVIEPILGKYAKQEFMDQYIEKFKLSHKDSLSIGDGANDIPMLKRAGLGIGYRPKPVVADEIDNSIIHGDLTAALYVQGYTKSQFVTA